MNKKSRSPKDIGYDEKTHHQYKQTKSHQNKKILKQLDRAIKNKDYARLMTEDLY
jgi:hypothetical protein